MIGTVSDKARKRKRKPRTHVIFISLLFIVLVAVFLPISSLNHGASDTYDPHRLFLSDTLERDVLPPTLGSEDLSTCLTEQCISDLGATISRQYPSRTDKSSWCLPRPQSEDDRPFEGILLTKVPKGASSTSAGVAIRIAARHGCGSIQWSHRLAVEYREQTYRRSQSFLFTTIRDPAARAVSTIFFHLLSRRNVTATDPLLVHLLKTTNHSHHGAVSTGQGGFQLRYTSLYPIPAYSAWSYDAPEAVLDPSTVTANVQRVIRTYDMILVTERMDESLTAMALLLGLDVGDVLVTSSKVAGSRYHLTHPNRTTFQCILPTKSKVGPMATRFLQSTEWRAMNFGDYLLHEAASQSLDLTIKHVIGQQKFDDALARYRRLRDLESEQCAPSVKFPCSDSGQPQMAVARKNCYLYYYDFGCGYPCIDQMIERTDRSGDANTD